MKHRASQFVTILAFIELIQNSSTFGLVIDVGESVNCLVDPPELGHSLSQLRWSITDLKRSHDRGSLNHAELERSPASRRRSSQCSAISFVLIRGRTIPFRQP